MTLEARLLEWGEDWARARGCLRLRRSDADEETLEHLSWARYGKVSAGFNPARIGWHVATYPEVAEKCTFLVWHRGEAGDVAEWTLTPLQFWLWAHAVDTGRTDSQRCPDCATRGGPMEWADGVGLRGLCTLALGAARLGVHAG